MNFTYLVQGPSEPNQEALQKYEHFVILVVLDDLMGELVLQSAGYELKSSNAAMCWLLRPEHLRTSPPGSVLSRLNGLLEKHLLYGKIDHSFLATASREEILSGKTPAGSYIPLHLNTLASDESRIETLRSAVLTALNAAEKPKPKGALSQISELLSAAELVKFIIEALT